MLTVSTVALVLVVSIIGAALAAPQVWRRVPKGVRRAAGFACVAAVVATVVLVVPATMLPDALDHVPRQDRAAVRAALRSAPGCWPTSRVTRIAPTVTRSARDGFSYTCSWTIVGWPSVSGEATCADGTWTLPGYLGPRDTMRPCGAVAR